MKYTHYYRLQKPEMHEPADVAMLNENMDIIDTRLHQKPDMEQDQFEEYIATINAYMSEFGRYTDEFERYTAIINEYVADLESEGNDYIEALQNQYDASLAELDAKCDASVAAIERKGYADLAEIAESLNEFERAIRADVEAWLASIKDLLEPEAAASLAAAIVDLQERMSLTEYMQTHNHWLAPVAAEDDSVILDEDGNAIIGEWHYKIM